MNRYLAIAYVLTIATMSIAMAIARGMVPQLGGQTALVVSQAIFVALLPAGILAYKGFQTLGWQTEESSRLFALCCQPRFYH
jgi:hypothetical protein